MVIQEFVARLWGWEAIILVLTLYMFWSLISWIQNPVRKIPGPKGSFLFGNSMDLASPNDPRKVLLEWGKTYGKIFKTWTILDGYRVHLLDPVDIKRVLVTEATKFERPERIQKILKFNIVGKSLFSSNGDQHAVQRRLLHPSFSYSSVQQFIKIFNEKANKLIELWENKLLDSHGSFEEEIQSNFTNLTLDVIGESAFGYQFNSLSGDHSKESIATDTLLRGQFNMRRIVLEHYLPFLKLFPSAERDKVDKAKQILDDIVMKVIKERREKVAKGEDEIKRDLLQSVLEIRDDEGKEFKDNDLLAQIRSFMVAGHETTSMTMTWTILLLAKYPEFQARAREEIRSIAKNEQDISWKEQKQMEFLDNCIKEALRLYPPGIFVGRKALGDFTVRNYTIRKGTTIFADIMNPHMDSEVWTNADSFNPDRHLGPEVKSSGNNMTYSFLPFSRGPRMCIGYRFAEVELKIVLAKILHRFAFTLRNEAREFRSEMALTLKPTRAIVEISKAS